ncbi:MAG: type 4a pilus biogenesis protein PilO [Deltaproteobacteria bacterium]
MGRFENLVEAINEKPPRTRIAVLITLIVLLAGGYWYFIWSPKAEELKSRRSALQKEEQRLKEYEAVAKELPRFEEEFKRLTKEFEIAAKKLPEEKEIPTLIDGVYAAVSASGLESIAFTPKGEVTKDIYAEIPIEINVFGSYFELANFFDRVSRLPRIVNVRDLNLAREDKKSKSNDIVLNAAFTAVTFRLLPPRADTPEDEAKPKKRGRKNKNNTKEEEQ